MKNVNTGGTIMTNEDLLNFSKRAAEPQEHISTEEATKMSLIAPFFKILGYDIFNPAEFCPEYTADVGIKKGEKVDYAILINGNPIILIEAKSINKKLDRHSSQLFRYFATTNARFAILTNGIIYRFYTDLNEKNKMDSEPFYEFNVLSLSPDDLNEIAKFSKECFNETSIFDNASILMYSNQFMDYIQEQLKNPCDDFVRLFLKDSYSGMKTQNVIDKFRPILRKSLNDYIDKIVKEKMTSLVNSSSYVSTSDTVANKLEPTNKELDFYRLIQNILDKTVEASDITYKKTESYFAVLYKNNVRKWIARIIISNSQITLILPDSEKNENRFKISNLQETTDYEQHIKNALNMYIEGSIPVLDPSKQYLRTKWGTYEMPVPYTIQLAYGERTDTKRVL